MNGLILEAIALIMDRGWQEIVPMIILAACRCLGVTYGFIIFAWTMPGGRIIRVGLCIALGLPFVFGNLETVHHLIVETTIVGLAIMIVIEMVIGLCLGFIMSLPFIAIPAAGAITDQFRGESDSGHVSPTGGSISTFGMLYIIIAFLIFANEGGMLFVVKYLYQSYEIWPLNSYDFRLSRDELSVFFAFLREATLLTLKLCLPLLIALSGVEFCTVIGARIAKRYNIYNLDFLFKNLATVLLLPMVAYYTITFTHSDIVSIFFGFDLIEFTQ